MKRIRAVVELDIEGDVEYDRHLDGWQVQNVTINGQKAEWYGEDLLDDAIETLCNAYQEEVEQ